MEVAAALPEGEILLEGLGADRVFDEERRQVFDEAASAHRLVEIEALVEVDAPIAVLADAFAGLDAIVVKLVEPFARVVGFVGGRFGGAHAEGPVARGDGELRLLLDAHAGADAGNNACGVVALAIVADHTAEQRVHGQAQRFAANIPQRQVERAQRVLFLAPGRIEEGARHVLPKPLDILRVLADEPAGALFQHFLGTAFADAGDARVGLDGYHQVALIEERIGRGRCIHANAGDFGFGNRGECA